MKMPVRVMALSFSVLIFSVQCISWNSLNGQVREPEKVVRLAELEIDPLQLETYNAALKEEIGTSIRVEPGVLILYAVAVKGHPEQVRLFEIYADGAAYNAHLKSAHFKKYKSATAGMVKSLRLIETEPIWLGAKGK